MVSFSTSAIIFTAATLIQVSSAGLIGQLIGALKVRGDNNIWDRQTSPTLQDDLNSCLNSASADPKPVMTWDSATAVKISGLSEDCVNRLDAFNASPQGATQNAAHGATDILNGTTVFVSNMSPSVTQWMHQQQQNLLS